MTKFWQGGHRDFEAYDLTDGLSAAQLTRSDAKTVARMWRSATRAGIRWPGQHGRG